MFLRFKIFFISLILSTAALCQSQSSFNSDNIHWSAWGYHNTGLHNQLGFRTVMERAIPETLADNTRPLPNARINLSDLSFYENIFAVNNNATSEGRGFYTNIPTDWLYLLTGGYYNVFYASRAADTTNQYVVLKEGEGWNSRFGVVKTINGKEYLSSGSNIDDINKILLRGPNYYQHKTYELFNQISSDQIINYKIQFEIKPGEPVIAEGSSPNLPMVACSVLYKVHIKEPQPEDRVYTLESRVKTYNELTASNNIIEFNYKYNLSGLAYTIVPPNDPTPYGTEYVINWLGNYEILAHKIELWDVAVWQQRKIDFFPVYIGKVNEYLGKFQAATGSRFYNNLRGWLSLNEPHTVDLLRPFRFVDSLCKYQFNTRPMFTQWYPN
ncbi:MAG: hypothetical protein HUU54_08785 [Ignavibacteriaceae bacterium]|nr:hypothetical protein [Ignavibacteriaceae bacterium]